MVITYEDLDLRIQADGRDFAVFATLGTQTAQEPFHVDLWMNWDLWDLQTRGSKEIESRGKALFEALIHGTVRDLYHQGRGGMGGDASRGLRIRILIDPRESRLRPFLLLPWEILRDRRDDTPLTLDLRRPVVRTIDSDAPTVSPMAGPLERVLVAVANPAGTVKLDVDRECANLEAFLARTLLRPRVLRRATRTALDEGIADDLPQIVHFMGHGGFDPTGGEGVLFVEDHEGQEDLLDASTLASFFVGKPAPRLVILNSCLTAVPGRSPEARPFSSVAAALVAAGLPAVIAMQSKVGDATAIRFTERLYRELILGKPIEAAVSEARLAVRAYDKYTLDWAVPVLFVRAKGGAVVEPIRPEPPNDRRRHAPPQYVFNQIINFNPDESSNDDR